MALYRALKLDFKVKFLVTMLDSDGLRSRSHGLAKEVLNAQARALGVPIIYGKASWEKYEEEFVKIINHLKSLGVNGGVFGDINIQEHKDWVEKVCSRVGVKAFEPLWDESYEKLINEFISNGFEALIVSVKASLIDKKWVGEPFNQKFIDYLKKQNIDLCGERGEFHTLVTYGPIFKWRIKILESRKKLEDTHWFLEILKFNLV